MKPGTAATFSNEAETIIHGDHAQEVKPESLCCSSSGSVH